MFRPAARQAMSNQSSVSRFQTTMLSPSAETPCLAQAQGETAWNKAREVAADTGSVLQIPEKELVRGRRRCHALSVSPSRPKKSSASSSANGRRPLYGLRDTDGQRTTGAVSPRATRSRVHELATAPVPLTRILGERRRDPVVERGRQAQVELGQPGRRLIEVRPQHGHPCFLRVRQAACQALVQHATERVDVGLRYDRRILDLLRSDVVKRTEHLAGVRQRELLGRVLRQPEVTEVDARIVSARFPCNEDVSRLDVTVDESFRMCRIERGGDPLDQPERRLRSERFLLLERRR